MGDMQITFRVNGQTVRVTVDASVSLGLILRNELGLRGTRLGCEQGACGACTVVVNGRAVQSCDVPIGLVRDKDVVTIDSLVNREPPHPLVDAILNEEAGQCGFCLAGIIMATYPLYGLQAGRNVLLKALGRNLCRCGAHPRILKALDTAMKEARS